MVFHVKIQEDGGLDFGSDFNYSRFKQYLKDNPGKEIKIEPYIRKRTIQQNKFYWMYLTLIERETGQDIEDMHELFVRTMLPPKFIKVFGQEVKIPMSTTDLDKIQFSDYLDKICAKTNVPIPDSENWNAWKNSAPDKDEQFDENINYK